jgi:hypothetical protein
MPRWIWIILLAASTLACLCSSWTVHATAAPAGSACRFRPDPVPASVSTGLIHTGRLTYTPALREWSFSGMVVELRTVHLLGFPARVARVRSPDFSIWVILEVETGTAALGNPHPGNAEAGDRVRVSIAGPYVLRDRVDWSLCRPAGSPVCRFGKLYDDGPPSLDWDMPLSPSNEFIQYGHPAQGWRQALFWNTEVIDGPHACSPVSGK